MIKCPSDSHLKMFSKAGKLLRKVNIINCIIEPLNAYRIVIRSCSSKKDVCGSKPVLLSPDCKTAVITGGVGGVGYATAHQLFCENVKKIALIGTDTKRGAEAITRLNCSFGKSKALFVKCDVSKRRETEEALKKIKDEFQEIDIVVNTAGVWDDINWRTEMETNLAGTINVNLAAKDIIHRGNGVIINLAGLPGLGPFPPSPLFASFASGIINFSQSLGHDVNYKKLGVRVVVLCLGITQTCILNDLDKKMLTKDMGKNLSEFLKKACSQKPDVCAKSVVEIIKFGPNGSVWLVEGSRLFYYNVPDYRNSLNLVSQFI